tara:strand:+ start:40 stop:441 length:402 start_codon:yes stop_codon:yes gene_type:complete
MFKSNISKSVFICAFFLLVSNCGLMPKGYLGHSTNTQVILSEANYRIINTVNGEATATYILGFGPNNDRLYSRAKNDLLKNANLSGGGNKSRALINITSDEQIKFLIWPFPTLPIWFNKTVFVTADIIEFKEN